MILCDFRARFLRVIIMIKRASKRIRLLITVVLVVSIIMGLYLYTFNRLSRSGKNSREVIKVIELPLPKLEGNMSVEEAIASRRSVRSYENVPLTLEQISQILWSAQGITDVNKEFRASPSAGALYPLELYLVVGEDGVKKLEAGVYHYNPKSHTLEMTMRGDLRGPLSDACLGQAWVKEAPACIVITAVYERTTSVYGDRGIRYVHIEVGHVGQNIYLQATALGLGTVAVGAFHDDEVKDVLGLPEDEEPLYVMPIGVTKTKNKLTLEELKEYYQKHRD